MKLLEAIPLLLDGTLSKIKLGYLDFELKSGYLVMTRDGRAIGEQAISKSYFDKDWEPVYSVPKVKVGDNVTIASSNPCYHGKSGKVTGVYQAPGNNDDVLATVDSQGSKLFEAKNLRVERVVTKVILGYHGVGKSDFAKHIPNTLEIDVDDFATLHGSLDLGTKLVDAVKTGLGKYDYIVLDAHTTVLAKLIGEGIKVTTVFPVKSLKKVFMKRYPEDSENYKYISENFYYDIDNLFSLTNPNSYQEKGNSYFTIGDDHTYLKDYIERLNAMKGN